MEPSQEPRRLATGKIKSAIKPIGLSRRTFIQKGAGAGIAGVAALKYGEMSAEAQEAPSGSWWPAKVDWSLKVEVNCDNVLMSLWDQEARKLGPPLQTKKIGEFFTARTPFPAEPNASEITAMRAHFGWIAAQKLSYTFHQSAGWEEWLTEPDGTGAQPSKFRGLGWSYGGNKIEGTVDNGGALLPKPGKNVAYVIYTENYMPSDIFQLGNVVVDERTGPPIENPSGGFYDGLWVQAPPPASPGTYIPSTSGITGSIATPLYFPTSPPNAKFILSMGNMPTNYSIQPQSISTTGTWPGATTGVGSLEVSHETEIFIMLIAIFPGDFSWSGNLAISGLAKLDAQDWRNGDDGTKRGLRTKAGKIITPAESGMSFPHWKIRVRRPRTLEE